MVYDNDVSTAWIPRDDDSTTPEWIEIQFQREATLCRIELRHRNGGEMANGTGYGFRAVEITENGNILSSGNMTEGTYPEWSSFEISNRAIKRTPVRITALDFYGTRGVNESGFSEIRLYNCEEKRTSLASF